jgi:RHS repeat-associated protein
MAFTLYGGTAQWDHAGKKSAAGTETVWVDDDLPTGAVPSEPFTWAAFGVQASFAYTGHYFHSPSNLHLAYYRAYDAGLGRWLSSDPIGEKGGINLYEYVRNRPIDLKDILGLDPATHGTGQEIRDILSDANIKDFDKGGKYHSCRYVDTMQGPVDLKHVTAAGHPFSGITIPIETAVWETGQYFSGYHKSSFAAEDLRSNKIGARASDNSWPSCFSGRTFAGEASRIIFNMGITSSLYSR